LQLNPIGTLLLGEDLSPLVHHTGLAMGGP